MDCKAVEEKLSAYLDGQLKAEELQLIAAHLEACPACRAELSSLEETVGLIRSLEPVNPPPELKERIMGRVQAVTSALGSGTPAPGARAFFLEVLRRLGRWPAGGLAAVAAVLLLAVIVGRGPLAGRQGVGFKSPLGGVPHMAAESEQGQQAVKSEEQLSVAGAPPEQPAAGEKKAADPAVQPKRAALGPATLERKVIQTGRLVLRVEDLDATADRLTKVVAAEGGFIQSSNLRRGDGVRGASYTLRVPAPAFMDVVRTAEKLGEVEQRELGGQDVTEEYVDVDARRRNLERQEERLLDILGRAKTVDDVLKVETQLERVRGEIESLTARLKYLDNQAALSTLTVDLQERPQPVSAVRTFRMADLGVRARQAVLSSINALLDYAGQAVVWLAAALPFFVLALALVAFAWWIERRRRKGTRS